MLATVNAIIVLLCLYLSLYASLPQALYPAPVSLLSAVALIVKWGRILPLLMVMLNICVLCMGAVVLVLALTGGLDQQVLSLPWIVAFMLLLLTTSTFNVLRLRGQAGVGSTSG